MNSWLVQLGYLAIFIGFFGVGYLESRLLGRKDLALYTWVPGLLLLAASISYPFTIRRLTYAGIALAAGVIALYWYVHSDGDTNRNSGHSTN